MANSSVDSGTPATLNTIVQTAAARLGSRNEAARLASLALGQPLSWIFAHGDEPLDPRTEEKFALMVEQRARGLPFAYIAGTREFFGREFRVSPAVLIPRPETEHLVEWALELDLPKKARVIDVGTGSGCVLLTLAAERADWQCTGIDVSKDALAMAAINRERFGFDAVRLLHGNMLEPLADIEVDLIVSNPPYVASGDPHLQQGDLKFEPEIALAAGPDGLEFIRPLIEQARKKLSTDGWLLIEHGYDQAEAVRELLRNNGYENVESRQDLAGIERVTGGRISVHE